MTHATPEQLVQEFDRQVEHLLQKGYHKLAGLSKKVFLQHIEPLRQHVTSITAPEIDLEHGTLPFVIVVKSDLIASKDAMSLVERGGKHGVDSMRPHEPHDFTTIDAVTIPDGAAYLLVDIDRGKDTRNAPPSEALKTIQKAKRSPLTIDEGIAVVTHFPDFLKKNNCFSLLASRVAGNQRVPAMWINAQKHPNLGWCWDGNPHTWLGSASCVVRIGS